MPDRQSRFGKYIILGGGACILLIGFACSFLLFQYDYLEFTYLIAAHIEVLDKLDAFRARFLSPAHFHQLRYLAILGLVMGLVGFIYIKKNLHSILNNFYDQRQELRILLKRNMDLNTPQWLSLGALILGISGIRMYLIYISPFLEDEVFSYVYFVYRGWGVTLSYYPGPNNHVFFNFLAVWVCSFLNSWLVEPVIGLRLVSLMASTGLAIVLFFTLKKCLGFLEAWILTCLFQLLPAYLVYSILGRGYALQIFFIGIAALALAQQFRQEHTRLYRNLFLISTILGFYTIPTFAYPMLSFALYGLYQIWRSKDLTRLWPFIVDGLWIVVMVLFLYSPILLIQGGGAIINNTWVQSLTLSAFFTKLPTYLIESSNFLIEDSLGLFWMLLLFIITWFIIQKSSIPAQDKHLSVLQFFLLIIPLPTMILQLKQPFPRVWLYLWMPMLLLISYLLKYSIKRWEVRWLLYVLALVYNLYFSWPLFKSQTPPYDQLSREIVADKAQIIYVDDPTYQVFLKYHFLKLRHHPQIFADKFTAEINYDWVILSKKKPLPSSLSSKFYKIYAEQGEVIAFQRIMP